MSDTKTYLLTTRPGKQSSVTTTLKKYYGDLIDEIVVRPADAYGLIHLETTHELPQDAFHRIVEVENVFEDPLSIDSPSPQAIEDGATHLVSQLPDSARITFDIVTTGVDHPDPTDVKRQVENSLGSKNAIRAESDEPTHRFHIALADDRVDLAVKPVS